MRVWYNCVFGDNKNYEFWDRDERFKLFEYNFPPYAENKIIKSPLVFSLKFPNKHLTSDNLSHINHLSNYGLFWGLVKEPQTFNNSWKTL